MAARDADNSSHEVRTYGQHLGQKGPARSFPCGFCGRAFRNAQALGGHMNVHRRERNLARDLMQLRNHHDNGPEEMGNPLGNPSGVQTSGSQDVISQTSTVPGDLICAGSSSSSSSPPSQASYSFANSLGHSVSHLLRRDSGDRVVDLELRLGHSTPDM